ncbi:MAG: hypothetical protein U0518_02440 [Candidatus Gracilibacteria bacterium]
MNSNDQKDVGSDIQTPAWYTNFLLPIGLIVVFLLIGGLYFGYQSYSASKAPKLPNESPSNINYPQVSASGVTVVKSETTMNAEWYNDAYKTGNAALCEKITIEKDRQSCKDGIFEKDAGNSQNISVCEKIFDQTRRNRCKDAIYYREATASNNNDICQKISESSSLRMQCINETTFAKIRASSTGVLDIKVCDILSDDESRNRCADQVNAKNSYDSFLVAQSSNSIDACSKISDVTLKSSCINQLAMDQAMKNKDISLCNQIKDENTRSTCQKELGNILDEQAYRQAGEKSDISLCEKISNAGLKISCKNDIFMSNAIKNKDQSLCEKITQEEQKTQCLTFTSK